MIDVFEIGASLNVHGNGMDFMKAFSGALVGAHGQLEALEKKIGATKGAMKDLFVGAGEVFAGAEILKGIAHLADAGKELNHQQSMLMRNGVSQRDVMRETADIYKSMLKEVPTASAVDFLRTLGELKTVKGSISEAREALKQSLKIEGLIGNSTGKSAEGQGYDFWRTVEDKGVIQDKAKTDALLNRMVQGTIATGGKIGGNDWFSYARAARSAWMGDDIESMPLQLMEMQTLTAPGAGSARRMFSRMIQGGQKLTKKQVAMFSSVGMLENGTENVVDRQLEHTRPDLFIADLMKHLEAHGVRGKDAQESWALRALNASSAAYFNVARSGMTEIDPESGLTRLQKERKNMGDAQSLDKAYDTMMKTDFGANLHALQEQWKSFTEAVGGPAAKAMIPVLQGVTSFVTGMANFADKNQGLTQLGVDIGAVAGGLLVLGGSVRLMRGALGLMGGNLLGMGRRALGFDASASALTGSATQLDASALALKEAAAALAGRGGVPNIGKPGEPPSSDKPGGTSFDNGRAMMAGLGWLGIVANAPDSGPSGDKEREANAKALDGLGRALGAGYVDAARQRLFGKDGDIFSWFSSMRSGAHPHPDAFASPSAYGREVRARRNGLTYDAPNTDGNALRRWEEMPIGKQLPESLFYIPSAYDREMRARMSSDGNDHSFDGIVVGALGPKMDATGQKFSELQQRTGVVFTSFDTLKGSGIALNGKFGDLTTGMSGLDNMFRIVEATGLGAARALASVAMSGGGVGGGSGITNASWEGGFPGGSYGGGGSGFGGTRGRVGPGAAGRVSLAPDHYVSGAGGGSFVPPGAEATTAGMRQNNLGNLGFFPGMHYAGLLGPSNARDVDHSIAKFDTQESGIRAAASLALHKYMGGRHDAWDLIAAKGGWTPGALGPGASVNVARAMGLSNRDDLHLDQPDQMVKFLRGLAVQEHGGAGRYYSEERIRGALEHRPVPVAGPSSRSKTIAPGRPAGGTGSSEGIMAEISPIIIEQHTHTHLDGKRIAHEVTRHQVADARFRRSVGQTDNYGRRAHPGSEVIDS